AGRPRRERRRGVHGHETCYALYRSDNRYRDPVTRTAPSGPARPRARERAPAGSGTASTLAKWGAASPASSSAGSARGLLDWVAPRLGPTAVRARSIASASFSARIEATIV